MLQCTGLSEFMQLKTIPAIAPHPISMMLAKHSAKRYVVMAMIPLTLATMETQFLGMGVPHPAKLKLASYAPMMLTNCPLASTQPT